MRIEGSTCSLASKMISLRDQLAVFEDLVREGRILRCEDRKGRGFARSKSVHEVSGQSQANLSLWGRKLLRLWRGLYLHKSCNLKVSKKRRGEHLSKEESASVQSNVPEMLPLKMVSVRESQYD